MSFTPRHYYFGNKTDGRCVVCSKSVIEAVRKNSSKGPSMGYDPYHIRREMPPTEEAVLALERRRQRK